MSMPTSTANWHWKNKDVTSWAKDWFERELGTMAVDGSSESISVSGTMGDGFAELGQRKSKLITIFEFKPTLNWSVTAKDGTLAEGGLIIPDFSHETVVDNLTGLRYEWSLKTDPSPAVDQLYTLAKEQLLPALEAKFKEFPVAMVDTHGKDLTVSVEPSRTGTPVAAVSAPAAASSASSAPSAVPASFPAKKIAVKAGQVVKTASLMASANDLYDLLTNVKQIQRWTSAKAQSIPEPGSPYSLWGGNVWGNYITLAPGKEIKQTWSLKSPTWPSEHEAELTITFEEGGDSTKVTFTLDGVPNDLKDEIGGNLEGYYIQGLKSFGLGSML